MIPGDSVAIDGVIRLDNAIEGETIGSVIRLGQNPVIQPLDVAENGTYEVPDGVEGFNPVRVDINYFWKSVTLEEDHTQANIANPVYWFDFFGIPREDIQNGWVYEVYVENNKFESYYVLYIRYALTPDIGIINNGIHALFARGNGLGANNATSYYLYAVKGTVFNIYRYGPI